jgi:hypothetical protein
MRERARKDRDSCVHHIFIKISCPIQVQKDQPDKKILNSHKDLRSLFNHTLIFDKR